MAEAAASQVTGLVLPGGGARAAYQVGVLRAIADLLPARAAIPFPVVTGVSAGALNATELAIHAGRFRIATGNLERVWRNFQVNQVYRSSTLSMLRGGLRWLVAMLSAGWLMPPPKSLLDNEPLRELLADNFQFDCISRSIAQGNLRALAIAAASYNDARAVTFFEAAADCHGWQAGRRSGVATKITLDHLMASTAVPFLFPPVMLNGEHFGDGSMRQSTPFSAAIRLGADRLLVIGARNDAIRETRRSIASPSFGQIFGYMLDALFSDGLYTDLDRLAQVNEVLRQTGPLRVNDVELKPVELLAILPSRDLSTIARAHVDGLPRTLRALLRSMNAMDHGGGELMSYLMFQGSYTRELIALGYQDAMQRSEEIKTFLRCADSNATSGVRRLRVAGENLRAG